VAQTLYEKYGGFKTISRVVMLFYEMALDSDQIGDYFEDIDMPRLIDHQTKFVSSLIGGPASFGDDRIEAVHRHLNISHTDFDEMAALFGEALAEHGMSDSDVKAAMVAIEGKRSIIVARHAA
jgi:hemoglobin